MPDSRQQLAAFIQRVVSVPLADAQEIAEQFDDYSLPKDQYFLKAGSYASQYLFLSGGFLRAYSINQNGDEISTAFYSSPGVVFEVYSFFNRSISRENIQALVDCEGLVIHYDTLNRLFHTLPAFRDFGRAMLVQGFSRLKERMLSQITETAEERYARLIQSNPEVFQYAALKDIATYLGVTDTSLSRIRRKFSQQ